MTFHFRRDESNNLDGIFTSHLHAMSSESAEPIEDNEIEQQQTKLSKRAQKRLLKAERIAASKAERRARQKATRKEKRKELKAQPRGVSPSQSEGVEGQPRPKRQRLSPPFGARVVIDLGFDDKMADKEVISLCSQLAYTYSANRKSPRPFSSLLFTSLSGRTLKRLESLNEAGYRRWVGTEWWEESYENLWKSDHESSDSARMSDKSKIVYLTADSEDELSELREDEIYIIGGICDHNRYKNLCENKARADDIRTARLPIGKFVANLPTRKVLTVNQVFDILLQWIDTQDWEKAFYTVIPKRKFQDNSKSKQIEEIEVTLSISDQEDSIGQVTLSQKDILESPRQIAGAS